MNFIDQSITDIEFDKSKGLAKYSLIFFDQLGNTICFVQEDSISSNDNINVFSDKSKEKKLLTISKDANRTFSVTTPDNECVGKIEDLSANKIVWQLITQNEKQYLVTERKSVFKQVFGLINWLLSVFGDGDLSFLSTTGPFDITKDEELVGHIGFKKKGRPSLFSANALVKIVFTAGFWFLYWILGKVRHKVNNIEKVQDLSKQFDVRLLISAMGAQAIKDR